MLAELSGDVRRSCFLVEFVLVYSEHRATDCASALASIELVEPAALGHDIALKTAQTLCVWLIDYGKII
jgi:hypothetical protein